ncbi:MAG: Ig-like domain-containing protein [Chloroflexi bacterium]|nr:Ig-like domain-containing protein [Chloroflexota bacterium]
MTGYKKFTTLRQPALHHDFGSNHHFSSDKGLIGQFLTCMLGFVAVLLLATPAQAHSAPTPYGPTNPFASEGLIPDNLLCGEGYRIVDTDLCTHGSDDLMPSRGRPIDDDVLVNQPLMPKAILCDGDGRSGKRVQVMYVRTEDRADRYAQSLATIRMEAMATDKIFNVSAQETGGYRHIRFVTDARCHIDVLNIVIPPAMNASFRATILALKAQGYDRPDRKYLMFVDADVYCGMATVVNDTKPSADNLTNLVTGYARMDSRCWQSDSIAHELVHVLGGVQFSAPHATGGWHCVDQFDLMCYSDEPYYPVMQHICPANQANRLDCGHDDYYHTDPQPDSYLATHWNVANSEYLSPLEALEVVEPIVNLFARTGDPGVMTPSTITITAQISNSESILAKVEFYDGPTLLEVDTTSPYLYTWQGVTSGTHMITAKAYDDMGEFATSSILTLIVPKAPSPDFNNSEDKKPLVSQLYLPLILQ